jgi:outer membrane protein assembly factor BamB
LSARNLLLPLLLPLLTNCAVYKKKDVVLKPEVNGKRVRVQREWSFMSRVGDLTHVGSRAQEMGGVTIAGDTLYFGNLRGEIYAMDRFTGRVLWKNELPAGIESAPLVVEKSIYLGCDDGALYALSVHGGKLIWKKEIQSELVGQLTFSGGFLYGQTVNGRITALDASTGKLIWEVKRAEIKDKSVRGASRPVVVNNVVYVGTIDGSMIALNAADGTKIWDRSITPSIRFSDVDTTPVISNNKLIVSAYDGKTYALALKDGSIIWTYDQGAAFGSMLSGTTVLVSTQDSSVDALDANSGKLLWRAKFDQRDGIATGVTVEGSLVAFGTTNGSSYLVSVNDGHFIWSFNVGAGMTSSPLFAENNLYMISNYGNLYAFSVR